MAALAALQLMWCMAASAADENEAQSATSPATAQDMKVLGTAITEFPAPILLPAPGSYQASCVNISQRHVAL